MEFTDEQIAKLVLGYLKSEGCKYAAKHFIKASRSLKKIASSYKSSYFSTRVGKLSLLDYLTEYSNIYTIVQDRLEYTSYYLENKHKRTHSLTDDLLYLLDNNIKITDTHSLATTPQEHSPTQLSETYSDQSTDNIHSSALEDLPGYDAFRAKLRNCIQEKRDRELHVEPDLTILTQTLLDSHELHEKIAENINLIRNSGDGSNLHTNTNEIVSNNNASQAVDSAIKAIVEKTENDPIYEKIINEIIGVNNENKENNLNEIKKSSEERAKSDSECYTKSGYNGSVNNRSDTTIDLYNSEAIQSIIAAGSTSNYPKLQPQYNSTPLNKRSDLNNCLNVNTDNPDIIFFEGNLENYVKSSNGTTSNNNLLMVKPKPKTNTEFQSTPNTATKSTYVVSDNRNVQSSIESVQNITEEDIIKMPTVILCDNDIVEPSPLFIPDPGLREYITMYKATSDSPKIKNLKVDIIPKTSFNIDNGIPPRTQLEEIAKIYATSKAKVRLDIIPSTTLDNIMVPSNPSITTTAKTTTENVCLTTFGRQSVNPFGQNVNVVGQTVNTAEQNVNVTSQNVNIGGQNTNVDRKRPKTPITPQEFCQKQIKRNPTPKSNESHVRVLDFNIASSAKECGDRKCDANKSKCVQSLFAKNKSEENVIEPVLNKPKIVKTTGSWDADLRELAMAAVSNLPVSNETPKPKKKPTKKKEASKEKNRETNENSDKSNTEVPNKDNSEESNKNNTEEANKNVKCLTKNVKNRKGIKNTKKKSLKTKLIAKENAKYPTSSTTDTVTASKEATQSATPSKEVTNDKEQTPQGEDVTDSKEKLDSQSNVKLILAKTPETKLSKRCIKSSCTKLELHAVDTTAKLMLSPTKLNANKRNLLEMDKHEGIAFKGNSQDVEKKTTTILSFESNKIFGMDVQDEELSDSHPPSNSNITPNMKPDILSNSIINKKNLSFTLETPIKNNTSMNIPKTPGIFSPLHVNDTPLTRVFKENLKGINLLDIPTPKFPLTPCVPITPIIDDAIFPNRATDYSTSSSYYQPSDTEENKYLEMKIIEECNKTGINETKTVNKNKKIIDTSDEMFVDIKIDEMIAEKMKSVASKKGKKNLSLIKGKVNESPSTSDTDSSSSTSSPGSSSSCSSFHELDLISSQSDKSGSSTNKTVIHKPTDVNVGGYCLRSRRTPIKDEKDLRISKENVTETRQSAFNQTNKGKLTDQKGILKEMEEKRQKLIMNINNYNNTKKPVTKKSSAKSMPRKGNAKLLKKSTQKKGPNDVVSEKKNDDVKVVPLIDTKNKSFEINKQECNTIEEQLKTDIETEDKKIDTKVENKKPDTRSKAKKTETKGEFKKADTMVEDKKIDANAEVKKTDTKTEVKKEDAKVNAKKGDTKAETMKPNANAETEKTDDIKKTNVKAQAKKIDTKVEATKADTKVEVKKTNVKVEAKKMDIKVEATKADTKVEVKKTNVKVEAKKMDIKVEATKTDIMAEVKKTNSKAEAKKTNTDTVFRKTGTEAEKLLTGLKEMGILLIPKEKNDADSNAGMKNVGNTLETKSKSRRKSELPKKKIKPTPIITAPTKKESNVAVNYKSIVQEAVDEGKHIEANLINTEDKLTNKDEFNLSQSEFITFDIKTYENETLHIIYDEKNATKKTLADYDFQCIKNGITASVYLEEIDCEIEKCMYPTQLEFLQTPDIKRISGKTDKRPERCAVKRKASADINEQTKKNKTDQELLENIELEVFLNRVHGTQ